ncbi:hypothetical protein D9Q98_007621 [Chlorella vulgaris]|uniref:Adenine/guanine permease AZG1 n=1 Tax=Chlorella vulgaris TaxID=3077 RepID=A0A9D4YVY8_CHLVU|nr:hypothetical protein D9Q98_007621 [Chlorella vulgaris]
MSAEGSVESGAAEGRSPALERLFLSARHGVHTAANAAGRSASTAFNSAKESLESLRDSTHKTAGSLDKWAAAGVVGRTFRFKERSAKFTTELRAGLITFLMVSYILAVNPTILQTTGGTCDPQIVCSAGNFELLGPQCLANTNDPGAQACMMQLTRSLITATAASSLISTFFIGFFGNLPLALAPGIGITAYVSYQVVGQYGTGQITYEQAMTAVFVEGFIFIVLSITGVRGGIIKYMPKSIAMASSVGIGMLLAFTGLRSMGLIVFDSATLLTLGGCPASSRNYLYAFDQQVSAQTLANLTFSDFPPPATVYGCLSDNMRSPTMWLGIAGGFLMCILLYMGVKGSLILGIFFVTIISWIPGHSASYLGASSPISGGQQRLEFFREVVAAPTLSATGLAWDWSAFNDGKLWLALLTFLYIDLLDCTGTLLSMARLLDFNMPGFLSDSMEFPGQMWAFLSDGIGIVSGSMMGTTPLTVFIESAAGIEDGGRTGLTAVVVAFFFLVSLFFSPIIASIPPYATGPALVLVGTILLGHIAHIEWDDIGVAIPAFLTMVLMPFTYSVAYGVIAGLGSYVAIHAPFWAIDYARRRWWPATDSSDSPRSQRAIRRVKTGYHMRKTFGPHDDPPSRADSFVGGPWYDDSYRTQDSRRAGLPVSMLPNFAAAVAASAAANGGAAAAGATTGSVPNSVPHAGRGPVPSVVNMFFPDGSVRGGAAGSSRGGPPGSSAYGRSGSAGDVMPPPGPGQPLYRKSYSMHSPGRATDSGGVRNLVPPGLAHRLFNRSLTDMHGSTAQPSPANSSPRPMGRHTELVGSASPHRFRAGLGRQALGNHSSDGARPGLRPSLGMQRSRTFSHGVDELDHSDDLHLKHQSNSEHGGSMFKLFPDAPDLGSADSATLAGQTSASFRLFGDVEPLPLGSSRDLELSKSSSSFEPPRFRPSSEFKDGDRRDTADLSFGGTSPPSVPGTATAQAARQELGHGEEQVPAQQWLEDRRRGSSAYNSYAEESLQQQQQQGPHAAHTQSSASEPGAGISGPQALAAAMGAASGAAAAATGAAAAATGAAALGAAAAVTAVQSVAAAAAATATAATARMQRQWGGDEDAAQQQQGAAPGAGGIGGGLPPSSPAAGGAGSGEAEAEEEQVFRKLMRTLSSRSLHGAAPRSGGSADGGGSAASSVYGGSAARPASSLKSGSLAAAAAQLATVYRRDSFRQPSRSESGGEGSLGFSPAGGSPEARLPVLGASEPAASPPWAATAAGPQQQNQRRQQQQGEQQRPQPQQRPSPFEGGPAGGAPEGGEAASLQRRPSGSLGAGSAAYRRWSGAAPDLEHTE